MVHAELVLLVLHTEQLQDSSDLVVPPAVLQVCLRSSLRW